MCRKNIYIVHTDDGYLAVRKKLENAKKIVRNILRAQGFTHELKDSLEEATHTIDADLMHGPAQWEIDSGKEDAPGNLYLTRVVI